MNRGSITRTFIQAKLVKIHMSTDTPVPPDSQKSRKELDKLRIENEMYLREHPELNQAIQEFVYAVLKEKPDDVNAFAAGFFTRPRDES